jgi:hypothetical protein
VCHQRTGNPSILRHRIKRKLELGKLGASSRASTRSLPETQLGVFTTAVAALRTGFRPDAAQIVPALLFPGVR